MKFRLLRGDHQHGGKMYKKNDIIESDIELDTVFGANKFQRLHIAPTEVQQVEVPEPVETTPGIGQNQNDGLSEMTVAELKQFAEEEEIDLDAGLRKDEIVNVIRATIDVM